MDQPQDARRYDDILALPRHQSRKHRPMPLADRAAQFMPFAALTGYDAAVREEARLTNRQIELDEEALALLNERLQQLDALLPDAPEVLVTYFVADASKAGGAYTSLSGRVKRIDPVDGSLILQGGRRIPLGDIWSIESDAFRG